MIYEVRVSIAKHRAAEWLAWIHPHVNAVVSTGCFTHATIEEVIDPVQANPTYVIRYSFDAMAQFERYEAEFAPALRTEGREMFGPDMQSTRAVLK